MIRDEFVSRKVTPYGVMAMTATREAFSELLNNIESNLRRGEVERTEYAREFAVVRTKLEEASFFAIKAISIAHELLDA